MTRRFDHIARIAGSERTELSGRPAHILRVLPLLFLPLLALLFSAPARADDTILSFDSLDATPAKATLVNQYLSQGIEFESGIVVPENTARSAPNVALGFRSGELGAPYVRAHFTNPHHTFVQMAVENTANDTVTLSAFDPGGNRIATRDVTRTTAPGTYTLVSVSAPAQNMAVFVIGGNAGGQSIPVDDIRFDNIGSFQGPDFFFYAPHATVSVLPGGPPQSVTVNVGRLANSTGAITLGVQHLPPGVSVAGITPNPMTGNSATIALRASPGAKPPTDPYGNPVQDWSVTVTGTPSPSAGAYGNRTTAFGVIVQESFDMQIVGMEVTQGIQTYDLPQKPGPMSTAPVSYNQPGRAGVPLAADKTTTARVFIDLRSAPSVLPAPSFDVTLNGYRDGQLLPGSPLHEAAAPGGGTLAVGPDTVSDDMRAGTKGIDSRFVLPRWWTQGIVTLQAQIVPIGSFRPVAIDCCSQDDSFTLTDVRFTQMRELHVAPFELKVTNPPGLYPMDIPWNVFSEARRVTPVGDYSYSVPLWAGTIDVTDIWNQTKKACGFLGLSSCDEDDTGRGASAAARLRDRADDLNYTSDSDMVVGIFPGSDVGTKIRSQQSEACTGPFWDCDKLSVAVVQYKDRPLSSVAHEMGHMFGRDHASGACGGGDNGQKAQGWPPDEMGYLEGVGYDSSTGRVLFPPRDGSAPNFYDYMSYCGTNGANDPNHWISVPGWNDLAGKLADGQPGEIKNPQLAKPPKGAVPQQANPMTLIVRALVSVDGSVNLTKVAAGVLQTPIAPDPASPYHLVVKNAVGDVLGDVGMDRIEMHVHTGANSPILLSAQGPLADAQSVEITFNGQTVAQRTRSASPPQVTVPDVQPDTIRAGVRVTHIAWQATDADGHALMTKVDYSPDGGMTWKPVYFGPNSDGVELPGSRFAASANGLISIRVSDGFNETTVVSPAFAAAGSAPTVHILSPEDGERVQSGGALDLSGEAADDAGHAIPDAGLQWYAGDTLLGTGPSLSVASLPVGTQRIRLTATDSQGRSRSREVTVQVLR